MKTQLSVVQFPHPGSQRHPKPLAVGAELPWNISLHHGRKFLLSPGTWVDAAGHQQGELTFWGEWEAQSRVVEVLPASDPSMPRALQRPWFSVTDTGWRQNTDPLVFGDRFSYTNCKQLRIHKLRALAPGSLVLFGSKLHGGFVLDTVLVVADAVPYLPTQGPPAGVATDHSVLVTEPLALDPNLSAEPTFTWYRGATAAEPVEGMYSFAPARPHEPGSPGFARPRIDLAGLVTPMLAMGAKVTHVSPGATRPVWDRVVEQVLAAGLVLATHLPIPNHVTGNVVMDSSRPPGRC